MDTMRSVGFLAYAVILDHLVHNVHRLNLAGESMRKEASKRAALDAKQPS